MRRIFLGLGAAGLLAILPLAPSVRAQTTASATQHERPFNYDVTKETTLNGKVSAVIAKPEQGMLWGSHIMVETSGGTVDASLGTLGMRGKNSAGFTVGDQVEVTGVMKTLNDKQVFLARTVKKGAEVYTFRNQNGFPVREASHDRESQAVTQKEVQP